MDNLEVRLIYTDDVKNGLQICCITRHGITQWNPTDAARGCFDKERSPLEVRPEVTFGNSGGCDWMSEWRILEYGVREMRMPSLCLGNETQSPYTMMLSPKQPVILCNSR